MYNIILVPLDGAKEGEVILPYVEETARQHGSKVFFLLVVKEPLMLEWDEVVDLSQCRSEFERRMQESESYLSALQKDFRSKGIEVHTKVVFGPVVKTILSVAEEIHADLIAMASHGWNRLRWKYNWSVTASVFQQANPPLLVVRSDSDQ
ncbi:MAG: universal stress protein [Proteobacteria bacterium]|nr:universal stress protein [Pseudomonadota bacterium]